MRAIVSLQRNTYNHANCGFQPFPAGLAVDPCFPLAIVKTAAIAPLPSYRLLPGLEAVIHHAPENLFHGLENAIDLRVVPSKSTTPFLPSTASITSAKAKSSASWPQRAGKIHPRQGTRSSVPALPKAPSLAARRFKVLSAQGRLFPGASSWLLVISPADRRSNFAASAVRRMCAAARASSPGNRRYDPLGRCAARRQLFRGRRCARVGIAQRLANDLQLVILDEPTDGVDPVGRRNLAMLLQLKNEGRTVFINSHLLSELEMMCDRVAILVAAGWCNRARSMN